jgi:hypothetical protein
MFLSCKLFKKEGFTVENEITKIPVRFMVPCISEDNNE